MGDVSIATLIEIGLLIAVWLRGWGVLSIVPVLLALVSGFLAGLLQLPVSDADFALFDSLGIAIWIAMLFIWPINLPKPGSILEAAGTIPIGNMGMAAWPFGKRKLYQVLNIGQGTIAKDELVQIVGRRGFRSTLVITKYAPKNVKQDEENSAEVKTYSG